jgi:signal transduction histidine kinase
MNDVFSPIDYLDKFKAKLIDKTLVVTSVLVVVNQVIGTIRSFKYGDWIGLTLLWCVAIVIIITTIFRHKFTTTIKAYAMILGIFIALTTGLTSFGFLASAKYYILIVPIILSFIVSTRRTIAIFLFFVLIFVLFGYLYISGILTHNFDTSVYVGSTISWAIDTGIIIVGSFGFIYFSSHFHDEVINNYNKIEIQNNELIEYKDHLESLVAERTSQLELTNNELELKNHELNAALDHLKQTQLKLLESEKMASLGILTAGVSHEINNPLNFIMGGYAGLVSYFEEHEIKDSTVNLLLGSINTGIGRASEIVKGLNQFSRNNEDYDEDSDINAIINNCLAMLQNQLKKNITIENLLSGNPLIIKGNVGKLHQLFMNILTNSIQAITNKGKITIITEKGNDKVLIEITDNGTGISKENLAHITEPFFTTKDPGQGTGLGLSISYAIIKDHNGTLEFESEIGKGTTVKITLPV